MAVTFNELLEGAGLSEEARVAVQEAWESRLVEAKEELTAELREEFAQRYEHDKSQIVEAVDNFITSKVTAEVAELAEELEAHYVTQFEEAYEDMKEDFTGKVDEYLDYVTESWMEENKLAVGRPSESKNHPMTWEDYEASGWNLPEDDQK